MGNKFCCCCDDDISKLDNQMDSLINNKKGRNMVVGDCDFCKKESVVCFRNYGSIDKRRILVCICCDIDLESKVRPW